MTDLDALRKENQRLRELLEDWLESKRKPRVKCSTCDICPPSFALREGRCLDCWYGEAKKAYFKENL